MRLERFLVATFTCCALLVFGFAGASIAGAEVKDEFNWYNAVPLTDSTDMLGWEESGGGDYQQKDECDAGMPFSCDLFPGTVPLIKAGAPGTYPSGSSAAWTYEVPGGPDAYVKEVSALGVNFLDSPSASEPHAFLGLRNGSSWSALDTVDETGTVQLDQVEGDLGDREIEFGLKADSTITETTDHWAGLAEMSVTLGDDVAPELDLDLSGFPTTWVNEAFWGIPAVASDSGLGLKWILATTIKRHPTNPWGNGGAWVGGVDLECTGNSTSPCPAESDPGFEFELRPAEMREGKNIISLVAVDPMNTVSNDNYGEHLDFWVDTIDPTVSLGGTFTAAPGMILTGPTYKLEVDSTDGNPSQANSGVTKIEVFVDNVVIDAKWRACETENCEMDRETTIRPDDYTNGDHVLKVEVSDAVGHVKTETVEFEVDR